MISNRIIWHTRSTSGRKEKNKTKQNKKNNKQTTTARI